MSELQKNPSFNPVNLLILKILFRQKKHPKKLFQNKLIFIYLQNKKLKRIPK